MGELQKKMYRRWRDEECNSQVYGQNNGKSFLVATYFAKEVARSAHQVRLD